MESYSNIVEQLVVHSNGRSYKESLRSIHRSFAYGDIPDTYRRMYEVADYIAAKEGLAWIQTKHKQDMPHTQGQEEKGKSNSQVTELPSVLEEQLFDFVVEKREEYIKRMIRLLEIRSAAGVAIPRRM